MSITTTHHIVLIGDEATKQARDQIVEKINADTTSFPNSASSRPYFEKSSDLVKTMITAGQKPETPAGKQIPVIIINVQTPESFVKMNSDPNNTLFNSHSFRYWWTSASTVDEAVQVIASALKNSMARLRPEFLSSRGGLTHGKKEISFLSAIREGLAKDGGLYTPKQLPNIPKSQLDAIFSIGALSERYADLALAVLEQLIDVFEVPPGILKVMVENAYKPELWLTARNVTLPVSKTEGILPESTSTPDVYLAELYHGPTGAFKDFALQLFPQLFAQSILGGGNTDAGDDVTTEEEEVISSSSDATKNSSSNKYMILAATSGDTGVSAIRGFMNGAPHVKVMVLYPKNGVSPVQRQQMLGFHGGNIRVVGVDGDFDFCQTTVKKIFGDKPVNEKLQKETGTKLSSANSINWGRLLPQVVYYFWIYSQVLKNGNKKTPVSNNNMMMDVVVPTGNFGNLLSGYFAKQLGVPIRKFVLASNKNDVLNEFVKTGVYDISKRSLSVTASPSIDILKASNVERYLYYLSNYDAELVAKLMKELDTEKKFTLLPALFEKMSKEFVSYKCSEKECALEIQETAKNAKDVARGNIPTMVDPHTAVAVKAAKLYHAENSSNNNNNNNSTVPMVIVSTAHWAKFPDCVDKALSDGEFPAPAETNALAPEKVVDIFNSVTSEVEKSFVSIPLAKTFENLGKCEVMVSERSVDEIIAKMMKFASK